MLGRLHLLAGMASTDMIAMVVSLALYLPAISLSRRKK